MLKQNEIKFQTISSLKQFLYFKIKPVNSFDRFKSPQFGSIETAGHRVRKCNGTETKSQSLTIYVYSLSIGIGIGKGEN